jgi:protein-disulfide isomerase
VRRNERAARLSSPRSDRVVTVTAANTASEEAPIPLSPPIGAYDHLLGVLGAELSLVEYGDFECPYCRDAKPVVDAVLRRLEGRLVFAFRHFPLAEVHPHALAAALASEGAALKGQFWPMYERLFAGAEPRLSQADLGRYAEEIGVPPAKVQWPATRFVEDRVEADFNSGVRSGVRGTPTLFVNGEAYRGRIGVDDLVAALTRAPATSGVETS